MQAQERVGHFVKSSVVGGEYYNAYVPLPLPLPPHPPLEMAALYPLLDLSHFGVNLRWNLVLALTAVSVRVKGAENQKFRLNNVTKTI